MKRVSRFFGRLPSFFALLAGGIIVVILCLLVGLEGWLVFAFDNGASASNQALYPFALGMILLCLAGGRLLRGIRIFPKGPSLIRRPAVLLAAFHVGLFFIQWMLVRSLWFYAGWDPSVVRETAMELAKGLPLSRGDYFQLCPNNAPLTLLLAGPYAAGLALGMAEPYVLLLLCGALSANLSSFLTVLCVARLTGSKRAMGFAIGLTTIFVLLSPHIAVPYTDIFSILFPILSLYIWISDVKKPLKWFLVALCAGLGMAIKATAAIFFLALFVISGIKALSALPWGKKKLLRGGMILLAALIGFAPGLLFQRAACTILAGASVPVGQLSMSHYLMLGLNQESYGGHSPEDVAFSQAFETLAEREKANYQEALRRLTSMDIPTAARFFSVKLFKAYDSGTFAWNGSFLPVETPRRSDGLSVFLRSIYHTNKPHNAAFISVYQTIWLLVLTLGACAFFLMRKSQPHMPLLGLTILGVTLYLMLFECWPRYLFLYAPFYVICATLGLQALSRRIFKRG